MKAFTIVKPGTFATIQDAGRPGLRRYGIPSSGAMDQFSYRIANLLVGNAADAAVVEVTLEGLVAEAAASVVVAITGADLTALWNDAPAPLWSQFTMRHGDRLRFTKRVTGCRAYLAVRGGFDAPEFLGSRSTFLRGKMGTALRAGDALVTRSFLPPQKNGGRTLPENFRPTFRSDHTIRVVPGPQTNAFTSGGLNTFLHAPYTISPQSDRQGFRTEGPSIETVSGSDIISDPTPLGAVQVPGDGKPIILHRDGQVTGGYAKIATVISADLDRFGQMVPGDAVRFQSVTREEALAASHHARQQFNLIGAMIGA